MVYELKSKVALKKNKAEITNILPKRNLQWKLLQSLQRKLYYFKISKRTGVIKNFLAYFIKENSNPKYIIPEIKGLFQTFHFFSAS